jgi:pyruvate/2-oxoglutarate dehydrogenase complex dihydrolipoamide acyltransferase (E2) component
MKPLRLISAGVLLLLLGTVTLTYAQQEQHEQEAKPEKQEQAKPAKQEAQAKPAKQEQQAKVQRTGSSRPLQRTQQEEARQRAMPALRLSARGEGRVPDDRFRSNFGSGHRFHIGTPRMVDGYSRFQYGGYWFGFVDP